MKKLFILMGISAFYCTAALPTFADDLSQADQKVQKLLSEEDQKEVAIATQQSGQQVVHDANCLTKYTLPAYDSDAADEVNNFDHLDIPHAWDTKASKWIKNHPATARKLYDDTQKTLDNARGKKCYVISYSDKKKSFDNAHAYLNYMQRLCSSSEKDGKFPYYCPKSFGTNEILNDLKNGAIRLL